MEEITEFAQFLSKSSIMMVRMEHLHLQLLEKDLAAHGWIVAMRQYSEVVDSSFRAFVHVSNERYPVRPTLHNLAESA